MTTKSSICWILTSCLALLPNYPQNSIIALKVTTFCDMQLMKKIKNLSKEFIYHGLNIGHILTDWAASLTADLYSSVFVDAMRNRSTPSPVPPMIPLVPSTSWNTGVGDGWADSTGSMRLRKYFFSSFVPLCLPTWRLRHSKQQTCLTAVKYLQTLQ